MSSSSGYRRNRSRYLGAILLTIPLGLLSRRVPTELPLWISKYPGDALWALMVFLVLGFIFPQFSTRRIATIAIVTSCAVEFFKLYQNPWLVNFRRTVVGHLIFGQVFDWDNLIAYSVGIVIGMVIELATQRQWRSH